jgi:hypothetical protein
MTKRERERERKKEAERDSFVEILTVKGLSMMLSISFS